MRGRARPGRAGDAGSTRGRLRGRGDSAAGWRAECKPAARGPGAVGQVPLSPSFAGTCGLDWVPRSGIRAVAEGRVCGDGRRSAVGFQLGLAAGLG